jgi:hypothetical protein
MPKIVVADSNGSKARHGRKPPVREQRMRRPDGQVVRVVPIDPNSPTFDDDLTHLFQRNIAKARRENKKLFGSPDGPRDKK